MNQKAMLGLAVLAVLMTAMLLVSEEAPGPGVTGEKFLPGLAAELPSSEHITISKGDDAVNLILDGETWGVAEREGYPADQQKLSQLTRSLAAAGILERKTARPENHGRLDLDEENATRLAIELPDRTLALFFGKAPSLGEGVFVRRDGDDQAWLIDQAPDLLLDPAAWLKPVVVDVDAESISRVELRDAEGASVLTVSSETDSDNLRLENLPADRELRYGTITNPFRQALTNLRLEDVARHDPARFEGARTAIFETTAGVITVFAIEADARRWIHLAGTGDDVADWDYAVAEYVFDDFVKELEDLLKPLPEEEA